jgi:hypothetical protein
MPYGFLWFSDTQRILDRSVSVFYEVQIEAYSSELRLENAAQYKDSLDIKRVDIPSSFHLSLELLPRYIP